MLVMNQLSRSDLEKDFIKKLNAKVFLKTIVKKPSKNKQTPEFFNDFNNLHVYMYRYLSVM